MEACCDVAVLAILPEEGVEEEVGAEEGEGSSDEELDLDVDVEDDEDPLFPTGGDRPRGAGGGRRGKGRARRKGAPKAGGGGGPPALVVTACDHDAALRWWELTPGRDAAVCTAVVPAFFAAAAAVPPAGSGGGGSTGAVGTLSLAQAGGVLLSAHLDGSLVVWHVGQRRPVARFGPLPLLESLALTPRALGLLCCFERHIVLARGAFVLGVHVCGGSAWMYGGSTRLAISIASHTPFPPNHTHARRRHGLRLRGRRGGARRGGGRVGRRGRGLWADAHHGQRRRRCGGKRAAEGRAPRPAAVGVVDVSHVYIELN